MEKLEKEISRIQSNMAMLESSLNMGQPDKSPVTGAALSTPKLHPAVNTDDVLTAGRVTDDHRGAISKSYMARPFPHFPGYEQSTKTSSDRLRLPGQQYTDHERYKSPLKAKTGFLHLLDTLSINAETQNILLQNGVDSKESLEALQVEDLYTLKLPLGQRRLLQKQLFSTNSSTGSQGTRYDGGGQTPGVSGSGDLGTAAVEADKVTRSCHSKSEGGLNTDIFLGMGIHGAQKPYHDIVDFLPRRSPYDIPDESKAVIHTRDDGSLVVDTNAGKEKTLEKVTWQQWTEANTHIMAALMNEGVDPHQYMTYTVIVSQLAQKYEWSSVLKYDREYRKKQANSGKAWGDDIPMLRDVILVPKSRPVTQTPGKRSDWSSSKQSRRSAGKNQQAGKKNSPNNRDRPSKPEWQPKYKICRAFNEGVCSYGMDCRFRHVCGNCLEKSHNESSCSSK